MGPAPGVAQFLFTAALLNACAGPAAPQRTDTEAAGTEPDALSGRTRADATVPSGTAGGTPIVLPGPPCTPGVTLGLCQLCTDAGQPALPPDDPACPPVDCAAFDAFEREDSEGTVTCRRVPRAPRADVGRCIGPGECLVAGTAELCVERGEPVEVTRIDLSCGSLVGCFNADVPVVTPQPEGTPCNGSGVCGADGRCSLSSACARFPGQRFCGEETVDGGPECEFFVATPDGSTTTCTAFCEAAGGCCVDAWPEAEDGACEHGGLSNCIDEHSDLVCRCTLQHEPDQTCPEHGAIEL